MELKAGMLVMYRDGRVRKVFKTEEGGTLLANHLDQGWNGAAGYNKRNFEYRGDRDLDIIKIFTPKDHSYLTSLNICDHKLIWDREKVILTREAIAEKFGIDVENLSIAD